VPFAGPNFAITRPGSNKKWLTNITLHNHPIDYCIFPIANSFIVRAITPMYPEQHGVKAGSPIKRELVFIFELLAS